MAEMEKKYGTMIVNFRGAPALRVDGAAHEDYLCLTSDIAHKSGDAADSFITSNGLNVTVVKRDVTSVTFQ